MPGLSRKLKKPDPGGSSLLRASSITAEDDDGEDDDDVDDDVNAVLSDVTFLGDRATTLIGCLTILLS
jgi:hypothetical protein